MRYRDTFEDQDRPLDESFTKEKKAKVDRLTGETRIAKRGFFAALFNAAFGSIWMFIIESNYEPMSLSYFIKTFSLSLLIYLVLGALAGLLLGTIISLFKFNSKSYDERWSKAVLVVFASMQIPIFLILAYRCYLDWYRIIEVLQ